MRRRRTVALGLAVVVAAVVAIQLVPYGRHHVNPPVWLEPRWDSTYTRELARRACFDCHSNETTWRALNFSEWDRRQKEARPSAKTVRKGEMPPWFYLVPRPHARLSDAERAELIRGLEATFGRSRG